MTDEFGGIAVDQPAAEERDEFGGIAIKQPSDEFGGIPVDREQHITSIADPISHAIQNPDDYESALEAQKRRDARPAGEKWAEAGQALIPGSGIYTEAAKEGVRFVRGLVQTPIHTALQAGATAAAPIARAVGMPQAGVDWIENEQLTHGAEATLAAQQAETSGRRSLRNIQRIPSGIGSSFMSLMGMQDNTTPAAADDYNARKLFDTKIAEAKAQQSIAEGKPIDTGLVAGASQLATGLPPSQVFGPESIAAHGARQPDPETVASMAAVTDPTNAPLPFLNRIPGLDKVAGAAAEGVGYAAQAPGALISAAGRRVGKAGTFAKVAGGATVGGVIGAGGDVLNDPSGALIGASILGGAKGLQWLGKGIQQSGRAMRTGTSDLVKEAAIARMTGKAAKANTAQRFIGDTAATGIATAVGDTPFNAATTEDPREFVQEQIGSGMIGAGFSAFQSARPQLVEAARPYLRMRGEQSLDANTPEGRRSSQILMQMAEPQRNAALEILGAIGNLPVQNAAGEMVPAKMVFQTNAEHVATITRTQPGQAAPTGSRGFFWGPDGTAYINVESSSFTNPAEAAHTMGHEFGGHAVVNMLHAAGEKGGQIYNGLMSELKRGLITPYGTPTKNLQKFVDEYNRAFGADVLKAGDPASIEEFLAETAGHIIQSGGAADLAMPKNALDHVTDGVGRFFSKFIGLDTRKVGGNTKFNREEVGAITNEVRKTLAQLAGMKLREGKGLPDPVETDDARIRELEEVMRQPRPPGTAPATEVDAWVAEQKAARSKLAELQRGQPPAFPAAGAPPVAPSTPTVPKPTGTIVADAMKGLAGMGLKPTEARAAINKATEQHGEPIESLDNLVRASLRVHGGGVVHSGEFKPGWVRPVAPLPAVDTTKTFNDPTGNPVKITGESTDPVKVGDHILTEGALVRTVVRVREDGSIDVIQPNTSSTLTAQPVKAGRFRVLTTEAATPAEAAPAEAPQNTVKPGPGGTFIIVDAAGNPVNRRTYKTAESAQRVADGQGKAARFKIKPNPNPEVPDVIDAVLEQGGVNLSGLSKEEAAVFIRDQYLRTLLSDPNGNAPDELARLLAPGEDGQQGFGDGDLRTLGTLIEDAYRARQKGESPESAAAKAEQQARAEAAKQPTQPPPNAETPEPQTSQPVPPSTNVATAEPPARDATAEPGALSRLQIDAIAEEARDAFLSDKEPAKSGKNKGQHTEKNRKDAEKAAFQAVAQAHAATLPPNYEGIKATQSPLGFPEVSGTVKPGRAFDDYLLELAGVTPDQLKTISDIQNRIGQTISVQYVSASSKPGEPNYAATRRARQDKSPAKGRIARGEGQEETKVFLPQKLKFNFGAKTFTVLGTNVEKLLGNFGWAEEAMQQAGEEMPYRDVHDPKLVADLKGLQANHDAGFTWDGNPIQGLVDRPLATNRPSAEKAPYQGFLDEEGMPDLQRFEFLNLLLGNEGARTGKRGPTDIQKAKLTLGEMNRGDVSDPVTAEGETNQLRDRLNAAMGPQEVLDADGKPTGETDRWSKVFMEDPLDEALAIENVTKINPTVERGESPLHESGYKGDLERHFGKLKPGNTEQERIAAAGRFLPEEAGAENASDAIKKRAAALWKEKGTESPFFQKWFGESKVTGKDGKPKVVHHAGMFDEAEDGVPSIGKDGFHFGTEEAANQRQSGKGVDDFIRSLKVEEQDGRWYWKTDTEDSWDFDENGFDTEAQARADGETMAMQEAEYSDPAEMPVTQAYLSLQNPMRTHDHKDDWSAAIKAAKAKGHDGIVYRNEFEDKGSESYIAFEPTQIKSANNEGTFDSKNPDIRFLPESPQDKARQRIEDRRRAEAELRRRLGPAYSSLRPEERAQEIAALMRKPRFMPEDSIGGYADPRFDIPEREIDRITTNAHREVKRDHPTWDDESDKYRMEVERIISADANEWAEQNPRKTANTENRRGVLDPEYTVRQIDAEEAKALDSEQGAWWLFSRDEAGNESEVIAVAKPYVPKREAINMAIEQAKKYGETKIGTFEKAPATAEPTLAEMQTATGIRVQGNRVIWRDGSTTEFNTGQAAQRELIHQYDIDHRPERDTSEWHRAHPTIEHPEIADTRPSNPSQGAYNAVRDGTRWNVTKPNGEWQFPDGEAPATQQEAERWAERLNRAHARNNPSQGELPEGYRIQHLTNKPGRDNWTLIGPDNTGRTFSAANRDEAMDLARLTIKQRARSRQEQAAPATSRYARLNEAQTNAQWEEAKAQAQREIGHRPNWEQEFGRAWGQLNSEIVPDYEARGKLGQIIRDAQEGTIEGVRDRLSKLETIRRRGDTTEIQDELRRLRDVEAELERRGRSSMPRLPEPTRALPLDGPLGKAHEELDTKIVEQQRTIVEEIKALTEQIDEYGSDTDHFSARQLRNSAEWEVYVSTNGVGVKTFPNAREANEWMRIHDTTRNAGTAETRAQRAELEEFRRSLVEDHANLHSLRESLRLASPTTLETFPRAFAEIRRLEVRGLISHEAKERAYEALSDRQNTEIARQIIAEEEARPKRERQGRIEAKIRVAQREAQQARTEQQTLWDDLLQQKDAKNLPKIARLWQQVSRNDDAFSFPRSKATDPADIAKEISTDRSPVTTRTNGYGITFSTPNGSIIIEDPNGHAQIGASGAGSRGKKQGGGSQLYQAAFAWAHNNGKVIHPSNALSTINAYVRRTSNMLSSALRFGTTRHMIPDADQGVKNWKKEGDLLPKDMTGLSVQQHKNGGWMIAQEGGKRMESGMFDSKREAEAVFESKRNGTFEYNPKLKQAEADANNIAQLAMRESEQVMKAVPALQHLDFNFKTGKIEANGNEVTPKKLGEMLEAVGKANTYDRGIGLSTAQRAIITASAMRQAETGALAGTDRGRGNRLVKEQRSLLYMPEMTGDGWITKDGEFLKTDDDHVPVAAKYLKIPHPRANERDYTETSKKMLGTGAVQIHTSQNTTNGQHTVYVTGTPSPAQRRLIEDYAVKKEAIVLEGFKGRKVLMDYSQRASFMPEDIQSIVPAIKINGKLTRGEKGMTHQQILDRHLKANPDDVDALMDFDTKANPNLFVTPDGQEITREQLKERFGVSDSQGLRRLQSGEQKFMPEDRKEAARTRQRERQHSVQIGDARMTPRATMLFLPEPLHHGTPHEVDRFTTAKIGTGEGAQVYGWGLYFAENPKVAEDYKKQLSPALVMKDANGNKIKPDGQIEKETASAIAAIVKNGITEESAIQTLITGIRSSMRSVRGAQATLLGMKLKALRKWKEAGIKITEGGNTYTVRVKPEPEAFIDWDKPIDQQNKILQDLWDKIPAKNWVKQNHSSLDGAPTGAKVYKAMASEGSATSAYDDKSASEKLASLGIAGIRYLDQGSRNQTRWIAKHPQGGENDFPDEKSAKAFQSKNPEVTIIPPKQTHNYVIFNEADIEITHRNGEKVSTQERSEALNPGRVSTASR